MMDLVCVVADKQIRAALAGLLERPRALGIRPITKEILLHPEHDPGCFLRPALILRGYRQAAEHALILLDHDWDGVPTASGADLEARIGEKLGSAGMADWAAPVVIDPELEAWVFGASPRVAEMLGWTEPTSLRETLEQRGFWKPDALKPADPKAALEYVLGRTGKGRSASLFRRLAQRAGTRSCRDRAFLRLRNLLRSWFPPDSSGKGEGRAGGSSRSGANVEHGTRTRKKLIEVALPLDEINAASAREKSIRHGHPSTLHLWWARRPLAAARAVIFAQLVDDPSAHPDRFPTAEARERERERLFGIIRELVRWENTNDEEVLERAREEIRESWRRACFENADHPRAAELFDPDRLPAFHDPFAGGGSLPLEAQRLGLEAHASDLNPVAVLINKAMIEIPPRFAGRPPVNPAARADATLVAKTWRGAQGLAEDVRHYGRWMRDEAEKRIGHLYPKVEVTPEMVRERPDLAPYAGRKLTVIAWLWARTVKSPNPAFADVAVPLASTFMLSTKKGKEAYVEPVVEGRGYRFAVKVGAPPNAEAAKAGTKLARGSFRCLLSDVPMRYEYIDDEANAGRMKERLMAIVVAGDRMRMYLSPFPGAEAAARDAKPSWKPDAPSRGTWASNAQGRRYGFRTFGDYFTPRQLVALTTFSDLVGEAAERVRRDAAAAGRPDDDRPRRDSGTRAAAAEPPAPPAGSRRLRGVDDSAAEADAGLPDDGRPLRDGGAGAVAYADAVALYLAFAQSKACDRNTSLCRWEQRDKLVGTFSRQALPMVWDFAETNPLAGAGGDVFGTTMSVYEVVEKQFRNRTSGLCSQLGATRQEISTRKVVSTDPPYYDNVGYADLSDFFYVWLRRSLKSVFPELFATLAVPKAEELVATPYRHENKEAAEAFFLDGMSRAMRRLAEQAHSGLPVTIYYAFKQSERKGDADTSSTGWETFLDAVIRSGFAITGTWPMRTELGNRMIGMGTNALASSIVLVCRRRSPDAPPTSRREFLAALRSELPPALAELQKSNIAPVDLQQAAIGPGMAIFTRYSRVLESDGSPTTVRAALVEINRMLDETLARQEGDLDPDTRFCVAWYEQYGLAERAYGEAEVLFSAKNTSFEGRRRAGVVAGGRGKVRLRRRGELDPDWDPAADRRVTDWEGAQHLTRALTDERGGGVAEAARLALGMGARRAQNVRALAYRLYTLADRRRWTDEARAYNVLVTSWPQIQTEAARLRAGAAEQAALGLSARDGA